MKSARSRVIKSNADPTWRVGIVHSSFYPDEVGKLVDGAKKELMRVGIAAAKITEYPVPGSFEIPLLGSVIAKEEKADALIGLGIIVEGQTNHAELLAQQSARGIMDVQVKYGIPFAFEVLYVKKLRHAKARCVGDDNKGVEAARAVLHSLALIAKLRS